MKRLLTLLVEQEYRSRKLKRLRKRIEEQLRSAAQPPHESASGVPRSTSDLSELLNTFRGSAPSDHILTKGTHFTHTQKFTFTQVRTAARAPHSSAECFNASVTMVGLTPSVCIVKETTAASDSILTVRQSEGDAQIRQQEELASLQQQFQQLCSDVDQLAADMKHTSVTNAQVTVR